MPDFARLTPTERRMLQMRALGLSYGEIAVAISRPAPTVRARLRAIARRAGCVSIVQALAEWRAQPYADDPLVWQVVEHLKAISIEQSGKGHY